jgi:NAD(P)-dependent dehydrogenase (short-subunit alcohol dehydrogenase family)
MDLQDIREGIFPKEGAALVIGGTGGIGRAVSLLLAESGSNVALTYRSNESAAQEIVNQIESIGKKGEKKQLIIDDLNSVEECINDVKTKFGRIHTVIYAAGPDFQMKYVNSINPDEFRQIIESDLYGFFNLLHTSLPVLKEGGGGSYVSVVTTAVDRYSPRDALSAVPKASVEMLTRAIAREEGRFGIRANCVGPGVIESGLGSRALLNHSTPELVDMLKKEIPLRKFGKAEDVATAVVFLASSLASFITGQTIAVDGGWQV